MRPFDLPAKVVWEARPVEDVDQDRKIALRKGLAQLSQSLLRTCWVNRIADHEVEIATVVRLPGHAASVRPDFGRGNMGGEQAQYDLKAFLPKILSRKFHNY